MAASRVANNRRVATAGTKTKHLVCHQRWKWSSGSPLHQLGKGAKSGVETENIHFRLLCSVDFLLSARDLAAFLVKNSCTPSFLPSIPLSPHFFFFSFLPGDTHMYMYIFGRLSQRGNTTSAIEPRKIMHRNAPLARTYCSASSGSSTHGVLD